MKVTRQTRIPLAVPQEGGLQGNTRFLRASELADALNRVLTTLPPEARVDPSSLQPDMRGGFLVLSWEEDLPAAVEIS